MTRAALGGILGAIKKASKLAFSQQVNNYLPAQLQLEAKYI
jgi:hypothetical protein